MQNEKSGKLDKFFAGKGFYIVLFLCVATIGISGYYLVRTVSSTPALCDWRCASGAFFFGFAGAGR